MDNAWLTAAAPLEEAAALVAHLVSIRSYPGQEGDVQSAVAHWLMQNGMPAAFQDTEGAPNVIARIENGPGPTLLFNGHVDTVLAARALARRRDLWCGTVIFSSVVDEEAYSAGARALVRAIQTETNHKFPVPDACIVGEPSFDQPVLGAVGKVLVRADITGKAAHGSEPERGINAAVEGAKLMAILDEMKLGHHPRLTPSQCVLGFASGSDQYVITVPEKARFTLNRHIVPGETAEGVVAEMEALAESMHSPARFTFAIDPPYYPPWEISREHPVIKKFARAYQAVTNRTAEYGYSGGVADAKHFSTELGVPTVYFGPRGDRLHQSDEWVDLDSIGQTVEIYLRLALDILETETE